MRAGVLLLWIAGAAVAQVISPTAPPSSVVASGSLAGFSYPAAANGASASVTLTPAGSTTPIPAQVLAVEPATIIYVVPSTMPPGNALVTAKAGNGATAWASIAIVPASLSLFGAAPGGPLTAQNIKPDGSAVANGLAAPAQPGQAVVVWGTGLGATPQSAVGITLGGVAQTVLYAGPAPGEPGLSQIDFRVAAGTPDGCYVPLTVTYGTQSVTSFLSKTSDGAPCHHPLDLTADALQKLDQGNAIQTLEIFLSTATEAAAADRASRQENALASLPSLGAANLAAIFAPAALVMPACASSATGVESLSGVFSTGQPDLAALTNGATTLALPWTSTASPDAPVASLPPAVLAGNKWSLDVYNAGASPAGFDFVLPPALQIAGGAPVTLDRGHDQTIAWNGAGFDSSSTVQLVLTAAYAGASVLTCAAPALAGAITIPSNLLGRFTGGAAGTLSLSSSPGPSAIPHALVGIPGLGQLPAIIQWTTADARPVDFQ